MKQHENEKPPFVWGELATRFQLFYPAQEVEQCGYPIVY